MKNKIITIISWIIVAGAAKVFLTSLPYKFTNSPDTQHIFGTIGNWMKGIFGNTAGNLFVEYGAYGVGTVELITSIVLLFPVILVLFRNSSWVKNLPDRSFFHGFGGLMAAGVMAGAAFFHLFTPLGIEVLHQGKPDGGSLFYAAVLIFILGLVMAALNLLWWDQHDTA